MSNLPQWVDKTLEKNKVCVTRYGRQSRGRPTKLESKWFFCGWYHSVEKNKRIVEGPFGPFPCKSAAKTDALTQYNLA